MSRTLLFVLVVAVLTVAAVPANGVQQDAVLGSQGEAYIAKTGAYGDLFPSGTEYGANQQVLALELLTPGAPAQRFLVPESDGVNSQASTFVLFENSSRSVFVVWEGRVGSHPMVKLATLTDGDWAEPIDVSQDPWSRKGNPRLAVTQDSYALDATYAGENRIHRTVLHVVWWEEAAEGDRAFYRPLILSDGVFAGEGEILRLNDFASADPDGPGIAPELDLIRGPTIRTGHDKRSVVVAFADPVTLRFTTLRLEVLPAELSVLADETRSHLTEAGSSLSDGDDVSALADDVRAHIIGTGYRMNPRHLDVIGDDVRAHIIATGFDFSPDDLDSLAGGVRAHIIGTGADLSRERLDLVVSSSVVGLQEIRTPLGEGFSGRYGGEISHLISIDVGVDLPAPETGAGATRTFTSASGTGAIVAWETESGLSYRESAEAGWGEALSLETSPELSLGDALELLGQRADNL